MRGIGLILVTITLIGCGSVGMAPPTPAWPTPTPTFSMAAARLGDHVTFHYPVGGGVGKWQEVCVSVLGRDDDKWNPGSYTPWETLSCHVPRFVVEDYILRRNAYKVWAFLITVGGDGHETVWRVAPVWLRPIEEE